MTTTDSYEDFYHDLSNLDICEPERARHDALTLYTDFVRCIVLGIELMDEQHLVFDTVKRYLITGDIN